MAQTGPRTVSFWNTLRIRARNYWKILISVALFASAAPNLPVCRAQLQQPLVFSSAGAVASRNDQTGALTPVTGSPFSPSTDTAFTLDVQGRFLFSLGTNSIHMFAITNSTTGAYQELQNSPFASSNSDVPIFIAVEPTGQYIAVVNAVSQVPGEASVETFQITTTAPNGPGLVPVPGSAVQLDSSPVGVAQPPNDQSFLIYMGPNPNSQNSTLQNGSEFQTLSINSQTGLIAGLQSGNASEQEGLSFAMDPQGRYYVFASRDNLLETSSVQLVGLDGQLASSNLQLPMYYEPFQLWIESTGSFVYASISDLGNPGFVQIYSLNFQDSQLTLTTSSPLPNFTTVPAYVADPTGSFDYGFGSDENTIIAYTVDPLTGYFIETGNSPFTIPQIGGSLTFTIPPGGQASSGPSISLSAASLSFASVQTGTSSTPQVITLTSNGGEALSVNSIALSGADASQFTESDTCQAPTVLQPNKFCSISITFAPTNTGSQQASLTVTDNAPGSPQSVQLNGGGSAPPPPAPAVSISPNPLNFPTITEGTTGNPMTITVTNSGNATLHLTSAVVGGNNPSDFTTATSACNGAINAQTSCVITVSFAPLAAGQRTETITLTDDASNSPQVINVAGTANLAVSLGAASSGSTSASVTAGQTATYNLQITPGSGYTGTVSLSCSGAPESASCTLPSSVSISNGAPAPFTVSVSTTGSSSATPSLRIPPSPVFPRVFPLLIGAVLAALLVWFVLSCVAQAHAVPAYVEKCQQDQRRKRLISYFLCSAALVLLLLVATGCGGGTTQVAPASIQPAATPQGNFTLTITPTANSTSGKSLQLQAIELTLTVN
jgi:Abnormal spindle-like microcephaly-assoc'd, ASPM-SPD-2-Hydin